MLGHIVVNCVHYSLLNDNNGHGAWNLAFNKLGALSECPARRPRLIRIHQLHRGVVTH